MKNNSPNRNTSGEKDFKEIDSEIKKVVIEGKSPNDSIFFLRIASLLSQNFNNSPPNQSTLYTNENNIWKENVEPKETKEDQNKFNMKFLNYNNNYFLNSNNKFYPNVKSNILNTNYSTNQHNTCINFNNQDYLIDDNENFITNQVSNMDIKSNNLKLLNKNESYRFKSFTDPCSEEVYYSKNSPRFLYSQSDKEPINKMFPYIEEKLLNHGNNDDSFDYTNLNEDTINEENIKYINNPNLNIKPRFILNKHNSNFSTNETVDSFENKYSTPKNDMFKKHWNYTEKKINFQTSGIFMNQDNQSNQYDNLFINPKASSFCNPSEYYINKQLMFYNSNDNNMSSMNFHQNTSMNNIEKLFSPNIEKTGDKKKSKKDNIPCENQYVIYLENVKNHLIKILSCIDRRTTLMIKNIPNKYNSRALLDEINSHFRGKYDFFYLPLDFYNHCNLGFAFINLVDPMHILLFYDIFNGKKWKKFKSDKICELAYAKFQGKKELLQHFEKSSVMNTIGESKKPMVFVPSINQKIELPLKYFDILNDYYPNCQFDIFNNKIVIKSLFR